MTRSITKLAAGLLAALLALSFIGGASASSMQYLYNFQKSTYPWTADVDCNPVPDDPCDTSTILQLRIDKMYGAYAALYNRGANAVWMRSDYFAAGNTLSIAFDAFPVANADRLTPLIYVGYAEPEGLKSFQKIGVPLQNGWQHLGYKVALPLERPEIQVVVAIGFMNLDGTRVKQAGGIDNVNITFYDR